MEAGLDHKLADFLFCSNFSKDKPVQEPVAVGDAFCHRGGVKTSGCGQAAKPAGLQGAVFG